MPDFDTLFAEHAARSFAKQLALEDYLGEHRWQLNVRAGTVDFGAGRVHKINFIGTEAESDGSFMWAWANTQSNLPEKTTERVRSLRAWGATHAIEALVSPTLPSEQFPGHSVAMVATGILQADAYYRGPYDGGAVFFMIENLPPLSPIPVERIVTVLSQVISAWELDHRMMAEAFLASEGFTLHETPLPSGETKLAASHPDGRAIELEFNAQKLISSLSARIRPPGK